MQYIIKKEKDGKLYSYYNEIFNDANNAITALNNWMEFEASILQYQLEPNTVYTINIEENTASIIKIVTTKENIDVIKKNMGITDLEPEEYLKRKQEITKIMEEAAQTIIFIYSIECYESDNFKLPENDKEKFHIVAYKNEVMTENNFLKTRFDFRDVGVGFDNDSYRDFYDFAVNVAETLNLKNKKKALKVKPDEKYDGRCFIYQGRKKIATVLLVPSTIKEVIV